MATFCTIFNLENDEVNKKLHARFIAGHFTLGKFTAYSVYVCVSCISLYMPPITNYHILIMKAISSFTLTSFV